MINERTIELINRQLDGELTGPEGRELDRILETDAESKALFQDLTVIHSELEDRPLVDAPPRLKARILESLPQPERTAPTVLSKLAHWLDAIWAPLSRRPALAVAYAFAVGLLVGLSAVIVVLDDSESVNSSVQGSMLDPSVSIVEAARTNVADLMVDLSTQMIGGVSVLEVGLEGNGMAEIQVNQEGTRVTLVLAPSPTEFEIRLPDALVDTEVIVSSDGETRTVVLPGHRSQP